MPTGKVMQLSRAGSLVIAFKLCLKRGVHKGLRMFERMPVAPRETEKADLFKLAEALVPLEAWTRQQGLDEFADLLEPAVALLDRKLTGR